MNRILIVSHWMEIGGAERSLLGLLDSINYDEYEVDLFLCSHRGEFMKLINKNVNLLPEDKKAADIAVPIANVIKNKNFDIFIGRFIGKFMSKIYQIKNKPKKSCIVPIENSNKFTYKFIKDINPQVTYDLAISFLEPHYLVANKVNAKRKVAWMHTDYSAIDLDVKEGYKVWGSYDNIVSISDDCTKGFLSKFPKLANKVILIENIISKDFIIEQSKLMDVSKEMPKKDKKTINILSIGRFCEAKNFQSIPLIARKLLDNGLPIKWYIIGFGGQENLIRTKISKYNVEKEVIILGKKENPYPYITRCDIYIQPSIYEGKSVCVREAQILNKPVIITNYPTAHSQIKHAYDGFIVPLEIDKCIQQIEEILMNEECKKDVIQNLSINDYTNKQEVQKIYELIRD